MYPTPSEISVRGRRLPERSRRLPAASALVSILLTAGLAIGTAEAQTVPEGFSVEVIHEKPGSKSLGFALLPDERILVIGHQTGQVRLLVDGEMNTDPVGTIPNIVTSSEEGLLGIAVDPDFPDSSYIYLFYTSNTGYNRVSRFTLEGDVADPQSDNLTLDLASERILLELPNETPLHNGGSIRFGSDKTLYVSHGEDQRWKEYEEPYMQDLSNPYGKILRIRRDGSAPDDNPSFPDEGPARMPEIFAIGLRNPFRFAIDPHTDRLFIGDVGTNIREEFNLSSGGENFGYPRYEGATFFQETYALIAPDPTSPIFDYVYTRPDRRSAIALAAYRPRDPGRDNSFPSEFDGALFYADYFGTELNYLLPDGSGGWQSNRFGTGFAGLTDAAVGPDGSLYLISYDGPLRRISYTRPGSSIDDGPIASDFVLHQNHPNPFGGSTTITYRLASTVRVTLEVFDMLGRLVNTIVNERQPAGIHAAQFRAGDLAPGSYLYRLRAGGVTKSRVMVHLPAHAER